MTAEVLGEVIHGGEILIRVRVDNLWDSRDYNTKKEQKERLIQEVRYGQSNRDYNYYLSVEIEVPKSARKAAVKDRITQAEATRCGCGRSGSWKHSVSGTSGNSRCVWAGCPTCSGSAVGRPILLEDLAWYENAK